MTMATSEEMERMAVRQAEVVDEEDFEDDNEEARLQAMDMMDSISYLNKAMHLLAVFGDTDVCKTITKRERVVMTNLSEQLREFLDEVSQHYVEEED